MTGTAVPRGALVAGVGTLAVFAAWSATDGGYAETVWYPAAVLLLVLVGVLAWAVPQRPLGRASSVLLAGAVGFAAWSYASIAWAGDRGLALTGANRTLTYTVILYLILRQTWRGSDAMWYAAAWAAITVGIGFVTLAVTEHSSNLEGRFVAGRLAVPIDYVNANAALFVLAAWPLLALTAARAVPMLARALGLGFAGAAVEIALLAQSKGAVLGAAAAAVVLLAVVRGRVRTAVPMAIIAVVVALFHRPLLEVYRRVGADKHPSAAVAAANRSIAVSFGLLVVIGAVVAVVDRRLSALPPRRAAALGATVNVVAVLALVGIAVGGLVRFGSPEAILKRSWHAFKYPPHDAADATHFLSTAGNHRYDFWRVAADQFLANPVLGAGADNFSATYVRLRRSAEEPLYPHSLEASLLGGNGLVGTAFFAVFVAAAGWSLVRLSRSAKTGAVVGAGALGLGVYWLAHGSVDWLWPFPALTGPAFALVGAAVAASETEPARPLLGLPTSVRRLAGACALGVAAVALVPAWIAARDVALGASVWRGSPGLAYSRFHAAATLNPMSDEPYVVAGTVAERRRDWPRVASLFRHAIGRNRSNWYSHLELGVASAELGERQAALGELQTARRLDPREPSVREVLEAVREGKRVPVEDLDSQLLDRIKLR